MGLNCSLMSFWNVCFISYNEQATTDSTHSTVLQSWDQPSSTSDAYLTVLRECPRGNKYSLSLFTLIGNLKFLVQLGFPARGQDLRVAVLQHQSSLLPFGAILLQRHGSSQVLQHQQHLLKATLSADAICNSQSRWNHETRDEEQRCKLWDNLRAPYTYLKGYLNLLL